MWRLCWTVQWDAALGLFAENREEHQKDFRRLEDLGFLNIAIFIFKFKRWPKESIQFSLPCFYLQSRLGLTILRKSTARPTRTGTVHPKCCTSCFYDGFSYSFHFTQLSFAVANASFAQHDAPSNVRVGWTSPSMLISSRCGAQTARKSSGLRGQPLAPLFILELRVCVPRELKPNCGSSTAWWKYRISCNLNKYFNQRVVWFNRLWESLRWRNALYRCSRLPQHKWSARGWSYGH